MLLAEMTDLKQDSLSAAAVVPNAALQENLTNQDRPPIYSSAELLHGSREAWIEHGQQMYRLRLTQAGKLYLTK
jgi:hemin uptake protein HemP